MAVAVYDSGGACLCMLSKAMYVLPSGMECPASLAQVYVSWVGQLTSAMRQAFIYVRSWGILGVECILKC